MPARHRPCYRVAAAWIALPTVAAILTGIAYEQVGRSRDRRRFPQVGRSVNIGGRTLNIFCSGEGDPTVVFDSGGHTAGYSWIAVQPEIAKFTRACWYDRAGYGWSDPGPLPRTSEKVAKDLHELLNAAAIPPPYVLAGPNLAGFHIRVYNKLYPGETAGAVLVDSSDPDALVHEPKFMKGPGASLPPYFKTAVCTIVMPAMLRLGILRLLWNLRGVRRLGAVNLTRDQQTELDFLSDTPIAKAAGEGCGMDESVRQVHSSGNFGDRPLIVLTSSKPFTARNPDDAKAAEAFNEIWVRQLQPKLAALSTRGRQVIVENGDFWIQHKAPTAVITAVREVVAEVRHRPSNKE